MSIYVDDTKDTKIPITLFLQDALLALPSTDQILHDQLLPSLALPSSDNPSAINNAIIPFDMRFDYDFALVANPVDSARLLQECSDKLAPLVCVNVRRGSIIVTFLAPSHSHKDSMISDFNTNGFELPSFGFAKTLDLQGSESEAHTFSAGDPLIIIGLCVMLAIAGVVAYCRFNGRRESITPKPEAVIEI